LDATSPPDEFPQALEYAEIPMSNARRFMVLLAHSHGAAS
jgi:hypothetical protein